MVSEKFFSTLIDSLLSFFDSGSYWCQLVECLFNLLDIGHTILCSIAGKVPHMRNVSYWICKVHLIWKCLFGWLKIE